METMMSLLRNYRLTGKNGLLLFLTIGLLLYSGFIFLNIGKNKEREIPWYLRKATCQLPETQLTEMAELTILLHGVLETLQVAHVLCYGTLWGALRSGRVLPWDNNVDICVTSNELGKISSSDLLNLLKGNSAETTYNSSSGQYEVKYKSVTGFISIWQAGFIYGDSLFRVGWQGFPFFTKDVSIPSRLLEAPFPTIKFYDQQMPIPHEDIEILKYLYPNDWWLTVKPLGCL